MKLRGDGTGLKTYAVCFTSRMWNGLPTYLFELLIAIMHAFECIDSVNDHQKTVQFNSVLLISCQITTNVISRHLDGLHH